MIANFIILHLLPSIGFILALLFLAHVLNERRSPASTLAWLMAIIFMPYVGVPVYLVFGGRKMVRKAGKKPNLLFNPAKFQPDSSIACWDFFGPGDGVFPPSANNRITLIPEGKQAFQTVMELIQKARESVYVATFILGKDETGRSILRALAERASQGVEVCLLIDALGSAGISRRFLAPLVAAGGQVAFFMPMLHIPFRGRANLRNHRKMIITDNTYALIGGMNLASEYMGPKASSDRWQDLSLTVEGPAVGHFADIFESDWAFANNTEPVDNGVEKQRRMPDGGYTTQVVASGPDVPNDSLRNAILTAIFKANRRVWIVTPYFIPDEMLLEALCIAAQRGVDVSIIIPNTSNHRLADLVREGYLARVQESGARVWLFQPRMLHAKAILIDDCLAIVGSANMDMRSLLLNYEVALCLYDANQVKHMESWMLGLKKDSSEQPIRSSGTFDLIRNMGRLLAPLL